MDEIDDEGMAAGKGEHGDQPVFRNVGKSIPTNASGIQQTADADADKHQIPTRGKAAHNRRF